MQDFIDTLTKLIFKLMENLMKKLMLAAVSFLSLSAYAGTCMIDLQALWKRQSSVPTSVVTTIETSSFEHCTEEAIELRNQSIDNHRKQYEKKSNQL